MVFKLITSVAVGCLTLFNDFDVLLKSPEPNPSGVPSLQAKVRRRTCCRSAGPGAFVTYACSKVLFSCKNIGQLWTTAVCTCDDSDFAVFHTFSLEEDRHDVSARASPKCFEEAVSFYRAAWQKCPQNCPLVSHLVHPEIAPPHKHWFPRSRSVCT